MDGTLQNRPSGHGAIVRSGKIFRGVDQLLPASLLSIIHAPPQSAPLAISMVQFLRASLKKSRTRLPITSTAGLLLRIFVMFGCKLPNVCPPSLLMRRHMARSVVSTLSISAAPSVVVFPASSSFEECADG